MQTNFVTSWIQKKYNISIRAYSYLKSIKCDTFGPVIYTAWISYLYCRAPIMADLCFKNHVPGYFNKNLWWLSLKMSLKIKFKLFLLQNDIIVIN